MSNNTPPLPASLPLPAPPLGPRQWLRWLGIGVLWILAQLPWPLQRFLGRRLGAILRWLLPSRRRVVRTNLSICYPERDEAWREALLRENFAALGIGVFEFARAWWGSIEPMRANVRYEGFEHIQTALTSGRGAILVSGHFMTLEICGRLLCDKVAAAAMYRPHDTAAMEWAIKRGRLRYASAMFRRDQMRTAMRYVKNGGALWYAPDQDSLRGENVFVPFFGVPARSLISTHQMARLSGAAVFAFFHRREPDGSYLLEVKPAFEDFPSADPVADTARVMAAIEAMVRDAPEQYLWLHKRFKRRPAGEAPIYD